MIFKLREQQLQVRSTHLLDTQVLVKPKIQTKKWEMDIVKLAPLENISVFSVFQMLRTKKTLGFLWKVFSDKTLRQNSMK